MELVSERPRKVLVTGLMQSNFMKQLYGAIAKVSPNTFLFDVVDLRELSGKNEYGDNKIFNREFTSKNYSSWASWVNILSPKYLSMLYYLVKKGMWSPRNLLSFTRRFMRFANFYKQSAANQYDIYHFHFPVGDKLDLLWQLKAEDCCIISFWGSDLFRISDFDNFVLQKRAMERANVITTHSIEMAEVILSKFGRHLKEKIMYTKFPTHDYLYELMLADHQSHETVKRSFAEKFELDPAKTWVVIGHNGSPFNNHVPIIKALSALTIEQKNSLLFIIPMAYLKSKDGSYDQEIKEAFVQSGLDGIIFSHFLSWPELANFRCSTDIMIHLPSSDALSGAMTEAIYAGSKVITGAWLPYSPLKKAGIALDLINDFSELPAKVSMILANGERSDEQLQAHRLAIQNNFFAEPCAKTWLPVLMKKWS